MEIILTTILSYLVGLAANLRTDTILKSHQKKSIEQLEQEDAMQKAIASSRPLRDELGFACAELARSRRLLHIPPQEETLWQLLNDVNFQSDLTEWFMSGGIKEGEAVKNRMLQRMESALITMNASSEQIDFLRTRYFDTVDKTIFAHPVLVHWRHQLSLDYLREQVVVLRQRAEETAGVYSGEKQKTALDQYCEKALKTWDIIDLSNLPEGDIHIVTQKILLRQLYMPLRIKVEPAKNKSGSDSVLSKWEEQREIQRQHEASHIVVDKANQPKSKISRVPIGERLAISRRLVVLGDPGGGKTTMLRWMATAFLMRFKSDDTFNQIPDTESLPNHPWIPLLIRCRDIGEADLCRSFTDFLTQHLNKTELLPEEAKIMHAVFLDRIAKGEILLLIDGLDEITDPKVRILFCQELERTAVRYPDTPIVVTSRIVGYRDMPYRMGTDFEHGMIAELDHNDKDIFARHWVEVTEQHQSMEEKARRTQELLDALHSNDRIERLTGNPMLLTTLALVKRKVGKLPNRRNKLYAEAFSVLLNWNPRFYETIEEEEAIPQLEYLAYEMCRRGVQWLTGEDVLSLLDKIRNEYLNIRVIRNRKPQEFLDLLEARSSIFIKSGGIWEKNKSEGKSIWEFRHLTFQEYLAAHSLLDGRYPDRDKTKTMAEQVAHLAGTIEDDGYEQIISEPWRETLRLLVVDCKDDDVGNVILAILKPMDGEHASKTSRPRSVLAALCLADEPNISEETARDVLTNFAHSINDTDNPRDLEQTSLNLAALEVGDSNWGNLFNECLIQEYILRPPETRLCPLNIWSMIEIAKLIKFGLDTEKVFPILVKKLKSNDRIELLSTIFTVMIVAYKEKAILLPGLIEELLALLEKGSYVSYAAALTLTWLSGGWIQKLKKPTWLPNEAEIDILINSLKNTSNDEINQKIYLIHILGKVQNQKSFNVIIQTLNCPNTDICVTAIRALGNLNNKEAIQPLRKKLRDPNDIIRIAAVDALVQLRNNPIEKVLLSRDRWGAGSCIDPKNPITDRRIEETARHLGITAEKAHSLYESIAADYCLNVRHNR